MYIISCKFLNIIFYLIIIKIFNIINIIRKLIFKFINSNSLNFLMIEIEKFKFFDFMLKFWFFKIKFLRVNMKKILI